MAITFHQTPQLYTPSDNPIVWVFSSSLFASDNFSFFVEVYVGGQLHSQHLVFPQVNNNRAMFDASDIAKISCSVPAISASTFSQDAGNYSSIYIKVFERYGTPPVNVGSLTSSAIRAFKSALSDVDFNAFNYQNYAFALSTSLWMTFFPRTKNMLCRQTNERLFLMAMTDNTVISVEVNLYNSSGGIITGDTIPMATSRIIITDLSPTSIIANSTLTSINFTAASYYTIQGLAGFDYGELLRIDLDRSCELYSPKRLHFLSSIGGIDSFGFSKASKESRTVTPANYEKQFGQFDVTNLFTFDLAIGRDVTFITTSKGKMLVSTDWLREEVQNWLARELYESPYVLIEKLVVATMTFNRTTILNSGYEVKQELTDPLFQETVELGLSDVRKSALV